MQDMRKLVDYLNETAYAYYTLSAPVISDKQWDALYDELKKMEQDTGVRLPDSPTHRVGGAPLPEFVQHRHITRLWSMDKAQTKADLDAWFDRVEKLWAQTQGLAPLSYAIEYKFDGLTLNVTYENGVLIQAATRGNGEVGEAILPQARTVRGVPLKIPYQGVLEVQGECIMRLSELNKYNATAQEPLKNARNAAAGALRNLDPAVTASRHLSAFFYQVGTIKDAPFDSQEGMLDFLKEQGFSVSPYFRTESTRQGVINAIEEIEHARPTLDFLIDGAVVKVRDDLTRAAMGYTDKFPRWAVAFKFEAEENTTRLEGVTWELGRTGKLTPLAHVAPVDFAGVTVQRATLNNVGDIERKKLKIGKQVWIRRSNDVIPEIMGCVDEDAPGEDILPPTVCPACGGALTMRGAHLYCLNRTSCKPQAVMRLKHYASRDAMDIDTFSEKTADLFYDKLNVRDPADLYHITPEQLLTLEGFKEKRARNLLKALEESKHCTLDSFLLAVGIPNVGKRTARDLARHFGTLEGVMNAEVWELAAVDQIGEVVAQAIKDYFSYPENIEMVNRLLASGVVPRGEQGASGEAFKGMSIVVTGTLPTLSRAQAEQLIVANGGVAASSVSKKTSFVVLGENAGSKKVKAEALGIEMIDEIAFLERMKN